MDEFQRLAHDRRGRQRLAGMHVLADVADIEGIAGRGQGLQEQQAVVVSGIAIAQPGLLEHHVERAAGVLAGECVVVHAEHAHHAKRHRP